MVASFYIFKIKSEFMYYNYFTPAVAKSHIGVVSLPLYCCSYKDLDTACKYKRVKN